MNKTIETILNKAKISPKAVFKIDGEIKYMDANSPRFRTMFNDFREQFVGVYDYRCQSEWLVEDLK